MTHSCEYLDETHPKQKGSACKGETQPVAATQNRNFSRGQEELAAAFLPLHLSVAYTWQDF